MYICISIISIMIDVTKVAGGVSADSEWAKGARLVLKPPKHQEMTSERVSQVQRNSKTGRQNRKSKGHVFAWSRRSQAGSQVSGPGCTATFFQDGEFTGWSSRGAGSGGGERLPLPCPVETVLALSSPEWPES